MIRLGTGRRRAVSATLLLVGAASAVGVFSLRGSRAGYAASGMHASFEVRVWTERFTVRVYDGSGRLRQTVPLRAGGHSRVRAEWDARTVRLSDRQGRTLVSAPLGANPRAYVVSWFPGVHPFDDARSGAGRDETLFSPEEMHNVGRSGGSKLQKPEIDPGPGVTRVVVSADTGSELLPFPPGGEQP